METKNLPLPSEVETIKENSNYLRGTIRKSLSDEISGGLSPADTNLIKFHGSYQQFDRDLESERKKQKLEPLFYFMIRVRLPGGVATPAQWLVMDRIAGMYANHTLKLTTRQTFQLHGIWKRNLKQTIREVNEALLTTIAACGDVNRNVMCNTNPHLSALHAEVYETARKISDHLNPKTSAYHEIWLDKKLVAGGEPDIEPVYGKTYLPRKFKIALAVPPYNDPDVFANDLGLIAIEDKGILKGFNIAVGGGMGMTFGNRQTYPRLATVIGYCPKEKALEVAEKILITQRDLGNRSDRKQARLKYTIDRIGIENFQKELYQRIGFQLEKEKPFGFTSNGDAFGWVKGHDGNWHRTLFIEGGRVRDTGEWKLRTALAEIAAMHTGEFRVTGNQNLIIANVSPENKPVIDAILKKHGMKGEKTFTALRLNSMACVALNTCGLAFAEAERYLPSLVDKLDTVIRANHLENDPIIIRMTGCPNGCGRPYLGEIGLVGKAPGKYNLYLGAGFAGDRLNKLYRENIGETEILEALSPIIGDYAKNRMINEKFGDFVIRQGYVKATTDGIHFHD